MEFVKKYISIFMLIVGMVILIVSSLFFLFSKDVNNFFLICMYSCILLSFGTLILVVEFGYNLKLKKIEEEQNVLKQISEIKEDKNKIELLKSIIE